MRWEILNPTATLPKVNHSFADEDIGYCQTLGQTILSDSEVKRYPDLVALGFWLRKANILTIKKNHQSKHNLLRPLGLVFHSSPANVDSLFAYSSIISLLCGNINVIRLSNRTGGSTEILIDKINSLATQYPQQNARMQLVKCDYQSPELLSLLKKVDARVLWGGEQSIQAQRAIAIPAHAREFTFSHKYSLCVLDAQAVVNADKNQLEKLVQNFVKDQITFSQQACTSAKAIIWIGETEQIQQAKQILWPAITTKVDTLHSMSASEHYTALANAQLLMIKDASLTVMVQSGSLVRIQANKLTATQLQYHQGNGLFIELDLTNLNDLTPMLMPYHQTVSHWGFEQSKISQWQQSVLTGVDRLVHVGQGINFDEIWDGLNLVNSFSRTVRCES
ncbi:acyl-CoA reductase [Shewanella aestuarii]|uniref:Acyl-CoA reductase n=1 Tax=Shewanella aestuarii TaxID=1028752 RepID=A0A6G9QJ97_9GAMM|nr:acyl-CoA reductase [Shewanella aestuarii]QIR13949.1 acyl-CoA reductase [Shewanella aestuarii]